MWIIEICYRLCRRRAMQRQERGNALRREKSQTAFRGDAELGHEFLARSDTAARASSTYLRASSTVVVRTEAHRNHHSTKVSPAPTVAKITVDSAGRYQSAKDDFFCRGA